MSKTSKQVYQSETGILVPLSTLRKSKTQEHREWTSTTKQADDGLSREQKQDAINRLIDYFKNL